jgi:sec-independent protein translocase protein TatC
MALVPFPSQAPEPVPDDDVDPDRDSTDLDDSEAGGKMSFLEHLDELRKRIIWSLTSVLAGFFVVIWFINDIFEFIMLPMQRMLPAGQKLIYTDPSEAFFLQIKIALIAGLIVAPIVWRFFVGFTNDFLTFTPRVEPAFSMYLRLVLAMGLTFELPTIVLFLARMGLASPRFMIRHFKYAVLLIVIAAAVLSPDGGGVGMVAMGGPVLILYIFSIGLAWAFGKKRAPIEEEA